MPVLDDLCILFDPVQGVDVGFLQKLEVKKEPLKEEANIRRRQPKQRVPLEVRMTAKYQERRRKNTLAAKRNRDMKKMEKLMKDDSLSSLEKTNETLRVECEELKKDLCILKKLVTEKLNDTYIFNF